MTSSNKEERVALNSFFREYNLLKIAIYLLKVTYHPVSCLLHLHTHPKHKGYFFILESFALTQYIFLALINKKLLLPL